MRPMLPDDSAFGRLPGIVSFYLPVLRSLLFCITQYVYGLLWFGLESPLVDNIFTGIRMRILNMVIDHDVPSNYNIVLAANNISLLAKPL